MYKKILVIFFMSLILSMLIYSSNNKNKINILFLGENNIINSTLVNEFNKYNVNTFTYNNITYKELLNNIKNNDYYVLKNNKMYLNKLIYDSDYIVLVANNIEYNKRCDKEKYIVKSYKNSINKNLNKLINMINKFSKTKIIVIDNNCNKDIDISSIVDYIKYNVQK